MTKKCSYLSNCVDVIFAVDVAFIVFLPPCLVQVCVMATNGDYPGEYCHKIGLTTENFNAGKHACQVADIQRGVIYELSCMRKRLSIPWVVFFENVESLTDSRFNVSFSCFKVMVGRLEKKRAELARNKRHEELEIYMSEPFCSQVSQPNVDIEIPNVTKAEKDLAKERKINEELHSKLSQLSIRNVNKRIKRRDEKLAKSQSQIDGMEKEIKVQGKVIDKLETQLETSHAKVHSLRQRVYRSNAQSDEMTSQSLAFEDELRESDSKYSSKVSELEHKIQVLADEVDIARHERDIILERLSELESNIVHIKSGQKFADGVRQCCIELLSMNVATKQVEPVIRSVLKNIASIDVEALPRQSTLTGMLAEMKCLAYQQISDEICQEENLTLHSDGTSKFGEHYESYQISTEKGVYSLGLCEMLTGSAELTLHLLKQIMHDLDLVAGAGSGNVLVAKIKNTMSDRHVVQKKFNSLLEDYRLEILPVVIQEWGQLTATEQDHVSTLNNFFCGMHVLVGMADTTSKTLLHWESAHFDSTVGSTRTGAGFPSSESGVVRLIRTTCKAMGRHGSEQSGVYQPFTTFLKSNNIKHNPLSPFKGNRFNILFYDAGVVFYLSSLIKKFLLDVWQTPNRLLKAVLDDIQIPEYLAGCKALGLVNKLITGPLWRVIDSMSLFWT